MIIRPIQTSLPVRYVGGWEPNVPKSQAVGYLKRGKAHSVYRNQYLETTGVRLLAIQVWSTVERGNNLTSKSGSE